MTLRRLVEKLEEVAQLHGDELEVVILDDEGEWPFGVHVEPEMVGQFPRMIVCLDVTDPDNK